MNNIPISLITVQQAIDSLSHDATFNAKTTAEKLRFLTQVQQDVYNLCAVNGKLFYQKSNLVDPLTPPRGSSEDERTGSGTASYAGTWVAFDQPLNTDQYVLILPAAISYVSPTTGVDGRTRNGYYAYVASPDYDGTEHEYFVKEY